MLPEKVLKKPISLFKSSKVIRGLAHFSIQDILSIITPRKNEKTMVYKVRQRVNNHPK